MRLDTPELTKICITDSCKLLFQSFLDPKLMKTSVESLFPLSEYQLQLLDSEGLLHEVEFQKENLTDPIYDLFNKGKLKIEYVVSNIYNQLVCFLFKLTQ